jgi:oxazoline/thiazoline synthase
MLQRPRFKSCFHVEVLEPQQVFLLTETRQFVLEGRAYGALAPLLDGRRSLEEILEAVNGRVPAPEIFFALDSLERKGYVVEAGESVPGEATAFWEALGADAGTAAARLAAARVSLHCLGGVGDGPALEALGRLGLGPAREGADLGIVVTDDYDQAGLAEINQESLAAGRPWMLVKPVGNRVWVGPLFVPGRTGCWECLAQRLRGNRQVEGYLQTRSGRKTPLLTSLSALPTTVLAAMNLAATEAARWLVLGRSERLEGRILTLDLTSLEMREHVLVRRPQCPACGDGLADREPAPPVLQSRLKRFRADGGHRVEPPEETFERLKHHISPITGVVSSLERLSDERSGLVCSYSAGHNFAMITDTLFFLRQNLRGQSGGKGMTDVQARVSGICEAMERYSGVHRGDEPSTRASYRALGEQAIHPNDCMRFSPTQYAGRHAWNANQKFTKFHIVPEPLEDDLEVDWTPVWSLTRGEFRYLPSAYCYYGHPDLKRRFFCTADANGNAAGSTLEEAVLQGFMELVERDSVALWWYNRIPRAGVDLDSFDEPYTRALADYYASINRECWVLDITSDLGIPTFVGVSRRTDRPVEDIVIGFGAHFDARVAILRALTEVNQFFPAVSRVNPDGSTRYWFHDRDAIEWWKTATVANQPYLAPPPGVPLRTASDYEAPRRDDLLDDVNACVEVAGRHGLEVFVLDQTRPDVGVSVAKVVVPGLRHFWRRLGGGRLYEVPPKMGWLPAPKREDEMNPVSIFF